jgi:membrane protein DedA with SNARE-associated domain
MTAPTPVLDSILGAMTSHNPWLVALTIISATLVHEDIATIAVGIAVADGMVGAEVALPSLYVGIMAGDLVLYSVGRLITLHRVSNRLLNRGRVTAFKAWLHGRLMLGVFAVRFLPGLRASAYVIFGFFAMPLRRFIAADLLATIIWTSGLFYLSYAFGTLSTQWLGYWRWPAIILAFGLPIYLVQHFLRPEKSSKTVNSENSI